MMIFFITASIITWIRVSDHFTTVGSEFIFYTFLLSSIPAYYCYLKCAFSDPGIIFRHKDYLRIKKQFLKGTYIS